VITRRTLLKISAVGCLIDPIAPIEARGSARKTDDLDLLADWSKRCVELIRPQLRQGTQLMYLAERTHAKQYRHYDQDCESYYLIEQFYVAYKPTADFIDMVRRGHGEEQYVEPAAMTFARSINLFSPNCDRVITHGLDPHRMSGIILNSHNDGGLGITLTLDEADNGTFVSLNMMTGFCWKRHYD
jgi:hypothetical protein